MDAGIWPFIPPSGGYTIRRPAEFLTDPRFFDISENYETQKLELADDLRLYSAVLCAIICVLAGFKFEESIPRPLLGMAPPMGITKRGACVHDYLYRNHGYYDELGFFVTVTRSQADAVYLECMLIKGYNPILARLRWAAVRAGGWRAWSKYTKDLA